MISIIIPVYNVKEHLDQCLQSVLAQTYTGWECVLVDDDSTDCSHAICGQKSRKRLPISLYIKINTKVILLQEIEA